MEIARFLFRLSWSASCFPKPPLLVATQLSRITSMTGKEHGMRRHRPLFVEGLENRAMLAGNVTVSVSDGTLFITGGDAGNGVSVQQLNSGRYFITGFNVSGGNTTVNGSLNGRIVSGVTNDIDVDLNGGADVFVMSNRASRRAELAAQLSGGTAGPIQPSPEAPSGSIDPGLTRVPRHLYIDTDEGNDGVGFTARVGSNDLHGGDRIGGDAVVNTGIHSDRVIALNSTIFDDLLIDTSDGVDNVRTDGTGTYGLLFADLGDGNDTFQSRNNWGFHSQIYGGAGHDRLSVNNYKFTEEVFLNGGGGDNIINATLLEAGHISVTAGAGSDVVNLTNTAAFGDHIVDVGDGNDDVNLFDTDTAGLLAVYLGGGNDDLDVGNTETGDTHFDGGAGFDNYDNNGGNNLRSLTRINFEA
jgi:hypothetical protein